MKHHDRKHIHRGIAIFKLLIYLCLNEVARRFGSINGLSIMSWQNENGLSILQDTFFVYYLIAGRNIMLIPEYI